MEDDFEDDSNINDLDDHGYPTIEQIYETMRWRLLPWQKEFIEAQDKQLILNCGRKAGKTVAECVKAARMMAETECPGQGVDGGILMLSKGQRQAKEILVLVRLILERCYDWNFSAERGKMDEDDKQAFASVTEIQLPNLNRVLALPCGYDANSVRPYSFHAMFFDEADFLPGDVFVSTEACGAVHDAQVILASTPNEGSKSSRSYFYKSWHDPQFRRWEVPTRLCPHVPRDWLARKRKQMTKNEYEREFECKFTDAQEGLYQGALIAACMIEIPDKQNLLKSAITYIGIDFARFGKDDSVIAYCSWDGTRGNVWVESIQGRHRTTHITGRIRAICAEFPGIRKVVTDETGVGAGPTDSLVEALGHRKVIGVENHRRVDQGEGRPSKMQNYDLHTNLIRLMENGKIRLDDDISIVRSLRSMRYEYTSTGVLRIYGHDSHIAEAIVRAVFPLMLNKPQHLWIEFGN